MRWLMIALMLSGAAHAAYVPPAGADLSQGNVTATGGTTAQTAADLTANSLSVKAFGAKADGQLYSQASFTVTAGTTILTVSGAPFNCVTDVGKIIGITALLNYGASFGQYNGSITACASASSVTVSPSMPALTLNSGAGVSSVTFAFGTDNSAALAAAIGTCRSIFFGGGEAVYFITTLPSLPTGCSGVTYWGSGATISTVTQATWAQGAGAVSAPAFNVKGGNNNVRFTGLQFIDTYINAPTFSLQVAQNLEVDHNLFNGSPYIINGFGQYNEPMNYVNVHDNISYDVENGVSLTFAQHVVFSDNTIIDTGYSPTYNQTASGNGLGATMRVAHIIVVNGGNGIVIKGNHSLGGQEPIQILGRYKTNVSPLYDLVIDGNDILGFREEGINFDSGGQTLGNTVLQAPVTAITTTTVTTAYTPANYVGLPLITFPDNAALRGQFFHVTSQAGATLTISDFPSNIASMITTNTDTVQMGFYVMNAVVSNNSVSREDTDVNTYGAKESAIENYFLCNYCVFTGNTTRNTGILSVANTGANPPYGPSNASEGQAHFVKITNNIAYNGDIRICTTNTPSSLSAGACSGTLGNYSSIGNEINDNYIGLTLYIGQQISPIIKANRFTSLTGGQPAITSCGSGSALTNGSFDASGSVAEGSGATGCTITFSSPFINAPSCTVSGRGGTVTYTTSATAIIVTDVLAPASSVIDWRCAALANGL